MAGVHKAYGEKVQRAALFGSKVRGDANRYSDIDILLIVTDDNWKFRKVVGGISSEIALKYDVSLDIRMISSSRWQYMADIQSGLYRNISRDSVPIKITLKGKPPIHQRPIMYSLSVRAIHLLRGRDGTA